MGTRLLKEGRTVSGGAGVLYEDVRYLSEGVTSEVYRARRSRDQADVVLKVLRPDLPPLLREAYWSECGTLGELAHAEDRLQDGIRGIPRLLERKEGDPSFIAMELAPGESLEKLVEPGVGLGERDALLVAERVLRVLQLLHEEIRRTYDDLQLKNIFLDHLETAGSRKVTLIDWNTLGPRVPDEGGLPAGFGRGDLARVGAYLYRILTGKGADERGEPEGPLDQRAGDRWKGISRGTQRIVLRALHPNSARRFTSAREFRAAVLEQQRLWMAHPVDLLGEVHEACARGGRTPEMVERLLTLLDMSGRLGATLEQTEYYRRQLTDDVEEVSVAWQAGQRYFSAEQYRSAVEKWEAEAEGQGRVALWRYVMLARVGIELGATEFAAIREELGQTVELLEAGQGARTRQLLDDKMIGGQYERSPSLRVIRAEAEAQYLLEEAEQLERADTAAAFAQAAGLVREAAAHLGNVPYGQLLAAEHGWEHLSERAECWEARARERQELDQFSAKLLKGAGNFAAARDRFELALQRDNRHRGVVNLGMEIARQLREQGRARHALELLELCLLFGHVPEYQDNLRTEWHVTLDRAYQEREVENERSQHAERMAALREEHEQEKAKLRERNAKALAEQRHRLNEQLKARKAELTKQFEAELRQLEKSARLEQARTLLETGRWLDFLDLVQQLPLRNLRDYKVWGTLVDDLDKEFNQAVDHQVGVVARPLMQVLAVVDPRRTQERNWKYETMSRALAQERHGLAGKIRQHILVRRTAAQSYAERERLLQSLSFLLRHVAKAGIPEVQSFLVTMHNELKIELAREHPTEQAEEGQLAETDSRFMAAPEGISPDISAPVAEEAVQSARVARARDHARISEVPDGEAEFPDSAEAVRAEHEAQPPEQTVPNVVTDAVGAPDGEAQANAHRVATRKLPDTLQARTEATMRVGDGEGASPEWKSSLEGIGSPTAICSDSTDGSPPASQTGAPPVPNASQSPSPWSTGEQGQPEWRGGRFQEAQDKQKRDDNLGRLLQDAQFQLWQLDSKGLARALEAILKAELYAEGVNPSQGQLSHLRRLSAFRRALKEGGHPDVVRGLQQAENEQRALRPLPDHSLINADWLRKSPVVEWIELAHKELDRARTKYTDLRAAKESGWRAYGLVRVTRVVIRHLCKVCLDLPNGDIEYLAQFEKEIADFIDHVEE